MKKFIALGASVSVESGAGLTAGIADGPVAGRMPGHMNVLLTEANVLLLRLVQPSC